MCFVLGMNTLRLEMNAFHAGEDHYSAGDAYIETHVRAFATHTALATSDFQAEFMLR